MKELTLSVILLGFAVFLVLAGIEDYKNMQNLKVAADEFCKSVGHTKFTDSRFELDEITINVLECDHSDVFTVALGKICTESTNVGKCLEYKYEFNATLYDLT